MMDRPENCILVIFGASGDLTKRKLLPSLFNLFQRNLLPKRFAILGVGRTEYSDHSFRNKVVNDVVQFSSEKLETSEVLKKFEMNIFYQTMDIKNSDHFINFGFFNCVCNSLNAF